MVLHSSSCCFLFCWSCKQHQNLVWAITSWYEENMGPFFLFDIQLMKAVLGARASEFANVFTQKAPRRAVRKVASCFVFVFFVVKDIYIKIFFGSTMIHLGFQEMVPLRQRIWKMFARPNMPWKPQGGSGSLRFHPFSGQGLRPKGSPGDVWFLSKSKELLWPQHSNHSWAIGCWKAYIPASRWFLQFMHLQLFVLENTPNA